MREVMKNTFWNANIKAPYLVVRDGVVESQHSTEVSAFAWILLRDAQDAMMPTPRKAG